ncbi:MAG: hypothetical protein KAS72_11060 [Phycisphaerales bacterium]|nr:hypothetical protein [Phycisphaerales bacterium]
MTALLFFLEPERVCIAMDTCSLSIEDDGEHLPGPFCSKMLLLPHLQIVVCGTGIRSLIYYWSAFLQQNAVARDVTELDNIARAKLPELADECGVTESLTSTIYHFGYWPAEKRMRGFAYRSANGFETEQLKNPGFGIKPPDGIDLEQALNTCTEKGLPAGFVEVMKRQKAFDDARPPKEQVGIGGEVQFLVMTAEGYSLSTCYRFDDYDRHSEAVRAMTVPP